MIEIDQTSMWYVNSIMYELQKLKESQFMGNIEFKLHFNSGGIGNMGITLYKSVKKPIERVIKPLDGKVGMHLNVD